MKAKQVIAIIISLAGVAWFVYYLLGIWMEVGYQPLLLAGTLSGLPVGVGIYLVLKWRDRRLLVSVSAGKPAAGWPLVWMFVLVGLIVFLVPLFNMLSELFFLAWASAALCGGFAWWFLVAWIRMTKKQ